MKTVLSAIFKEKRSYAELPFFQRLRDERLSPEQRLSFYPCMAHFILSFGDLNKYVLRSEAADCKYQRLVNEHTAEDDHHWPWYLEDFTKLGFDAAMPGTDWMRFLWSDATRVNRILSYRLAAMIEQASSVERLIIIEAIEETGNVLFSLTANLAREIEARRGISLRYCGDFHFQLETGHAVGADHRVLAEIQLDDAARERGLALVRRVFALFEDWTTELLRYAEVHPVREMPRVESAPVPRSHAAELSSMNA